MQHFYPPLLTSLTDPYALSSLIVLILYFKDTFPRSQCFGPIIGRTLPILSLPCLSVVKIHPKSLFDSHF